MRLSDWMDRYRSTIGNLLLVVVLIFSTPDVMSITIGFFLLLGGSLYRAWSTGFLPEGDDFPKSGPFSLSRNPKVFGNFLIGLGVAVGGNHITSYLIFILYFIAFFPLAVIRKHRRLEKRFGEKYIDWAQKTNTFIPRLKRMAPGEFNISAYMKNREYRVIYFSLFVIAVLVSKFILTVKMD